MGRQDQMSILLQSTSPHSTHLPLRQAAPKEASPTALPRLMPTVGGRRLRFHFQPIIVEIWRRQWHPTPVLLPGKSHGWRSLVGCSPWGCKESDTTKRLHFHFLLSCIGEENGNPLQVFLPGESQERGSLVGCHLWARTELDTTEVT